ncbi:hypothetical protein Dsin_015554 [Dipteronia sinensis]|uniref:histidine kinase n=1 Tax=Dipteronia sinensis TaxID=43782 RepID=A0AAE0E637_9ROSI|nr:hypothetical protein Dsin_015554 [Dipteronia sinensis]
MSLEETFSAAIRCCLVENKTFFSKLGHKTTQTETYEGYDEAIIDEKPLTGKIFLVAEDNVELQKLARINLTRFGATMEVCQNREEALQLMPIMNCFEATKKIKKKKKYYEIHIPIIALTAHVSGEEAKNTILAGMDDHLGKPLKKENLLEAIR